MEQIKKRNLKIKKGYHSLRKKKISQFDAFSLLSKKYFLSLDTIKHIVWVGKS